jgi:hypothetical protein
MYNVRDERLRTLEDSTLGEQKDIRVIWLPKEPLWKASM